MRYYELTVSDPASGQDYLLQSDGLLKPNGKGPLASSLYTAQTAANNGLIGAVNPGALNIEFDLPVTRMHEPQGAAWIRLWGVGIRALGQASDLNRVKGISKTVTLKGGMSKGLPLANPSQAGIIVQGKISQAFGNWSGVNQTLELYVIAEPPLPGGGAGISWNWKEGQSIQDAISQTLAQSMPSFTPNINISQNLVAPNAQPGCYQDFSSWASILKNNTRALGRQIYGDSYQGVQIATLGGDVFVYDGQGPTKQAPKDLAFQDLIGQPTWIAPFEVSFQTVMRADISIADLVTFPKGIMPPYALTTPDAAYPNTPAASSIGFQGTFKINEVHHFANFRQADASAWNTTFKAYVLGHEPDSDS